jgi:hypothetical protein
MDNEERSTSIGTVIAIGFILLGVLNLFASRHYRRTTFSTGNIVPAIIFISVGLIILIVRAIQKTRE